MRLNCLDSTSSRAARFVALCLPLLALPACDRAIDEDPVDDGLVDDEDPAQGDPAEGDPPEVEPDEPGVGSCEYVDPQASADVAVERSEWPQSAEGEYEAMVGIETSCTIVDVDAAADPVRTVLECDDEGVTRALTITIGATERPVAWAAGDEVEVQVHYYEWDWGYGVQQDDVIMRRADDGALLLASMSQEQLYPETFAPVVLNIDEDQCKPEDGDAFEATWNLVIELDNGAGDTVAIGHQQRGTLVPADGDGLLAIDVGEARYGDEYCCHAAREVNVLLRRTLG